MARAVRNIPWPKVESDFIPFQGGMDLVTPPLFLKSSYARNTQNWECDINGGYRQIDGYERFDGRVKPSDGLYAILNANISGSPAVGNTLVGATSGATAVIIAITATYFALTKVVGTYVNGENLNVGGPTIATASGTQMTGAATTAQLHAQYLNLAADQYRTDILAVPGSGSILGGVILAGTIYAWRNNAGGTAAAIYKASATGWQAVALFYELSFSAGSGAAPAEGATITKGAVSAVVKRVVLQSGSWAGGTAAGRFIIAAPAGGSFSAGAFTAGVVATCSGAEAIITLLPNGRYEIVVANFAGSVNTKRAYGCDGVNRGFEFDGTVLVPIVTGMATDAPRHVREHKNYLFFSFGSSVQFSGPGTPYIWTPILGAGELGMGDDVTGFMNEPGNEVGGALAIFSRNRIGVLYGSGASTWNLVPYKDEQGALEYSVQHIGITVVLDDIGMTSLTATQAYGNFVEADISLRVKPFLTARRPLVRASSKIRDKNQYRLFFTDKYAVYTTIVNRKVLGIMACLYAHKVQCTFGGELSDGSEAQFFGSDDGFVYQMDKGTSFDGQNIERFIDLTWAFQKSPRILKHYRKAVFEIQGSGYAEFDFTYQFDYGSSDQIPAAVQDVVTQFSAARWDSFTWDAFIWDGQTLLPSDVDLEGDAENVSMRFQSSSDYFSPIKMSGANVFYTPRRRMH